MFSMLDSFQSENVLLKFLSLTEPKLWGLGPRAPYISTPSYFCIIQLSFYPMQPCPVLYKSHHVNEDR